MSNFSEILHILPLLIIAALLLAPLLWKTINKQNLVIKQLDPLLLILSAIGVSAGTTAHDHCSALLFDPCFGYAAVMLCVSARLLGLFKKLSLSSKKI